MLTKRARPSGGMRRQHGVTLLELAVTVSIAGILLAVGVPQLSEWVRNNSVAAAADSIQNGLRRAVSEAVRRNGFAQFALTNSTPAAVTLDPILATANGRNFVVRIVTASGGDVSDGYLTGLAMSEVSSAVSIAGPAGVNFDGMGRAYGPTGTALSANQVFRVSRTGASRAYCVFVTPGGAVKMCDPSVESGNPRSCQPQLSAAECAAP